MRFPDDVPTLTDGTVTLRAHTSDDIEGVYEQCNDPVSLQWTTVPVPYTRQDAADFIARRAGIWEDDRDWGFAIEADGGAGASRFGGTIALEPKGSGIGELAFGAHPGVRGRGVMTAAAGLILDWGFGSKGLHTVTWAANAGNYPSWRVAWKTGFTFEGGSRATLPQRGKALDAWHGTLLATDSRDPKTRWLTPGRLEATGVVLREVDSADESRYLQTATDAESMQWLSAIPLARTRDAFRSMYRNRLLGASLGAAVSWTIADPATDSYLGSLSMFGIDGPDHKSAEVGYRTHPDARGSGVMTAALRLAAAHAFRAESQGGLGLHRLSLGAAEGNVASQRVARAGGFIETGRDRRCYELADGSVVDLIRFDLLARTP